MNILALDGGPGPAFVIRILEKVQKKNPQFLESVDVFSGTSDGAIMSLYLARALTLKRDPLQAITDCIKFNDAILKKFKVKSTNCLRFISGQHALFDGRDFYELLQRTFGDMVLDDLAKKVQIFSFDTSLHAIHDSRTPKEKEKSSPSPTLVSLALEACAFPLLLPGYIARRKQSTDILDGGLIHNSVGMATLMGVMDDLVAERLVCSHAGVLRSDTDLQRLKDVKLLSMGIDPANDEPWLLDLMRNYPPALMRQWLSREPKRHWFPSLLVRLIEPNQGSREFTRQLSRCIKEFMRSPLDWEMDSSHEGGMTDIGWVGFLTRLLPFMVMMIEGSTASDIASMQKLLGGRHYFRFGPEVDAIRCVFTNMLSPDIAIQEISHKAEQIWASHGEQLLEWITNHWMPK